MIPLIMIWSSDCLEKIYCFISDYSKTDIIHSHYVICGCFIFYGHKTCKTNINHNSKIVNHHMETKSDNNRYFFLKKISTVTNLFFFAKGSQYATYCKTDTPKKKIKQSALTKNFIIKPYIDGVVFSLPKKIWALNSYYYVRSSSPKFPL